MYIILQHNGKEDMGHLINQEAEILRTLKFIISKQNLKHGYFEIFQKAGKRERD